MTALPKHKMTVEEYLPWALGKPAGRYELVRGEVIAMSPERARHNLCTGSVFKALDRAIRKAGLPCTAFTDGMTVKIDDYTAREPDAAVQCGKRIDPDTIILDAPLIVVEVVSPSSERDDTGSKLAEYFLVPSIQHYLIVDPERKVVIHHARQSAGDILTKIHTSGEITFDPPQMTVTVEDCLQDA